MPTIKRKPVRVTVTLQPEPEEVFEFEIPARYIARVRGRNLGEASERMRALLIWMQDAQGWKDHVGRFYLRELPAAELVSHEIRIDPKGVKL